MDFEEEEIKYNWSVFVDLANENGINLDHKDDYDEWWKFWKAGYDCSTNDTIFKSVP